MSKDAFGLLKRQIPLKKGQNKAISFERDVRNARSSRLQELLSRYRCACTHVAKRPNDECLPLKADCVVAVNQAESKVSHFLRGSALLMNNFVTRIGNNIFTKRYNIIYWVQHIVLVATASTNIMYLQYQHTVNKLSIYHCLYFHVLARSPNPIFSDRSFVAHSFTCHIITLNQ